MYDGKGLLKTIELLLNRCWAIPIDPYERMMLTIPMFL